MYWSLKIEDPAIAYFYDEAFPWLFDAFAVTSDITLYAAWEKVYTYEIQVVSDNYYDLSGISFTLSFYNGITDEYITLTTDENGYISYKDINR